MSELIPLSHFLKRPNNRIDRLNVEDRKWLFRRAQFRAHPRRLEAAARFVERSARGAPFYLYGAGTHTHGLLEQLAPECKSRIRAIIDKSALPDQTLMGHPVLPPQKLLDDRLPPVFLSHHEFEDNMADFLLELGIPDGRIHPIYANDDYGETVSADLWRSLQTEIDAIPKARGKRVVFLNARQRRILGPQLLTRLRSSGDLQFIQLKLDRWSGDHEDLDAFDAVLNTYSSLSLALNAIERLGPDLIYVQDHYSSGNILPLLAGLSFPGKRVIGEFYDFLPLTFDDPYVMHWGYYWRKRDVSLALASERWCIDNLDRLVTKESGPVLKEYLNGCDFLEMQPHLSRERFRTKRPELHTPPRLVWAGAVASYSLSPIMFGDAQLAELFRELDRVGLDTAIYSSCKEPGVLASDYGEYMELAANSRFEIHPALPLEALLDTLANSFDFGLVGGIPKPNTQQGVSYKVTVSGKMFTYIAAGIPLIVSHYVEVMADWVRQHGMGLVYKPEEVQDLPALIAQCDYPALVGNVERYREQYNLESELPALMRLIDPDS